MEDKDKQNIGCLVVIALGVIGGLIYNFATTDSHHFYEFGMLIIGIALAIGAYLLIKHFGDADSGEGGSKKGCLIAIAVVIGAITLFNLIEKQGEIGYTVGVIGTILIAIIIGVLIYINYKE